MSYENTSSIPIEYDYSLCFTNYITGKQPININLLNLAIDDSEKFELLNKYKRDLESFESEYEIIKSSGLDIIEIENKILNLNDVIDGRNKIINENTEVKLELERQIESLTIEAESIINALRIKDSMNDMLKQHEELRLRILEINELKNKKEEYLSKIIKDKNIDYLALGHIHAYKHEQLDARASYCYPGCLEGRGFDEVGEHGFVLLDVNEEDGTYSHESVPFAKRKLYAVSVDVTDCQTSSEMIEKELKVKEIIFVAIPFLLSEGTTPSPICPPNFNR